MGSTDQAAAEGHLDHAVRHLETARQLFVSAAGSPELSYSQRGAMRACAADADVELDRLTRLVAGETLEGELARLVAELDEHAERDERESRDER